ncbi:MAG TPA: tetratricopeptide repeat protein [Verrucomicrobiae bacterium]|nr:tetratricopeptide repeat protein [Verrucomicrobiae bacterium]
MPLPNPADNFRLKAAEGWLELGDWNEANNELDTITPKLRANPEVLRVRLKIYEAAGKWDLAVEVARAICVSNPGTASNWTSWAAALHQLKRTEDALNVLLSIIDRFPDDYLIPFHLARYTCRLGRHKEAFNWLEKAIDLDSSTKVRLLALEDQEFEPLWAAISEI